MKKSIAISLRGKHASVQKQLERNVPKRCAVFVGRPEDADAVARFSHALYPQNPLERATARRMLRHGHVLAFGLTDAKTGDLAGSCVLEFNRRQRRIYINEIGVRAGDQGRGLGRWLMEAVFMLALKYGYLSITSHIAAGNASSLMLHRHFGFTLAHMEDDYYDDGGRACYMRKVIKPP